MTILKKSFTAAGLDKTLSGTGPFTVFAPSDLAFEKLDKGVLENLMKPENKAKLINLINYHVVQGKIKFKEFKDGEKLQTVNGEELVVRLKDGNVIIGDAKIQGRDMQTSNGVIHSLDVVMIKN